MLKQGDVTLTILLRFQCCGLLTARLQCTQARISVAMMQRSKFRTLREYRTLEPFKGMRALLPAASHI